MMETAMGILARTLGAERAGDCAAALSSGVLGSIIWIRCASAGYDTNGDPEFSED